jgi:hypothetical protein
MYKNLNFNILTKFVETNWPKYIFFSRCDRFLECSEIICGLYLFKGLDEPVFDQLVQDIKQVEQN